MAEKTGAGLFSYGCQYIGRIVYGHANSGNTYDCSGFIRKIIKEYLGIDIGITCEDQVKLLSKKIPNQVNYIPGSRAVGFQVGDLLYKLNYSGSTDHVMMSDGNYGVLESSSGARGVRWKKNYSWAYKDLTYSVRLFSTAGSLPPSNPSDSPSGGVSPSSGSEGSSSGESQQTYNSDYAYVLTGGLPLTNVDSYKGAIEAYLAKIKGTSSVTLENVSVLGTNIGYVIDLAHNKSMRFILPEFSDPVSASYDTITIPGRSASIPSYSGTNSREITFSIDLFAGTGFYTGKDAVDKMLGDINFLRSLCYPDYSSGIVSPPPVTMVYLGPNTIIKGIITNVNPEYKKPFTTDGRPMRISVSVTIQQATDYPPDSNDILTNNSSSY